MLRSLPTWFAAFAVTLALVVASPAAAYEPFVTDFPEGVPPVEPYEPFVTSFGRGSLGDQTPTVARPPAGPEIEAAPALAVDWPSLGVGMAAGLALAVLVGGAFMVARRHRRAVTA